jgi:hypothetical protein
VSERESARVSTWKRPARVVAELARSAAHALYATFFVTAACTPKPEHRRDVSTPPCAVPDASSPPLVPMEAEDVPVLRRDVTIAHDGIARSMRDDVVLGVLDELDAAFVCRIDLFSHLKAGDEVTVWTQGGHLVAAEVRLHGRKPLRAILYDGALAPRGFYDEHGKSLRSALRSRPVHLARITSHFGERFDAFTGERAFHHGIDYGVPVGTPVLAVGDGRVKEAGSSRASGNYIKLAHRDGYESLYLHLSRLNVKSGDIVHMNDVVGLSGNTGRSTGPHLHYELHLAGIPLDPLATMPASTVALGPRALRDHVAFFNQLEAIDDRRADQ